MIQRCRRRIQPWPKRGLPAQRVSSAGFGYADWLAWFGCTAVANAAGGPVLVTLLRLLRSKDRLKDERAAAEADDSGSQGIRCVADLP